MPMYLDQLELELDAVEERGAGRLPQEMAKNPALSGEGIICPWPNGIPPRAMARKKAKTLAKVGTEITQVIRRSKEG